MVGGSARHMPSRDHRFTSLLYTPRSARPAPLTQWSALLSRRHTFESRCVRFALPARPRLALKYLPPFRRRNLGSAPRARGAALRSGGTMDNQQQKRVFLDFLDQQGYMEEVHGMLGRQVGPVSVRVRGRLG